jgi:tRNA(His) guanylyltransferase
MANSQYEYVKDFESSPTLLPHTYTVVRIDGVAFSQFSAAHQWHKPMDERAVALMNACAIECMRRFPDITMAYGVSDEFSFLLHPYTTLYNRRIDKLITVIASTFASQFVFLWSKYFDVNETPLQSAPSFDARATSYPTIETARDYFSWRQVDCHINALYNLAFSKLMEVENLSPYEAHKILGPTDSGQKNEILFSRFGINYNNTPAIYRKGSIILWELTPPNVSSPHDTSNFEKLSSTHPESISAENFITETDPNSITISSNANDNSLLTAAAPDSNRSPPNLKRVITIVHEDLINATFYERHVGIIPYIPSRALLQAAKIAKKKLAKQLHKKLKNCKPI